MTCYVDPLCRNGWRLRGHAMMNCHLFTDTIELDELHEFAARIGMKPAWFQKSPPASIPHYDLTPSRREAALRAGAIAVDRREAVRLWRARRARIVELFGERR